MLSMEYYLTVVISTMIILCELIMAGDIDKWSPDKNGVCKVNMEYMQLSCPITKGDKLPNLISVDDNGNAKGWKGIFLLCQPSSSGVFDINLTSSVFGENFRARFYNFNFEYCNFNLSPDLFDNVVPYDVNSKAEYSLKLELDLYTPNLYFNNPATNIKIHQYKGDMSKLRTALENSNVVMLMLDIQLFSYPARFFTHMTILREITVYSIKQWESHAFWRVPYLAKLLIYTDFLTSKSLNEIGRIDNLELHGPLTLLENGSIHSISSIGNIYLKVNHDAFVGQTFHNVASISYLHLDIYPNVGPNCTSTSAECDVRFDFGGTKIRSVSITMNEVLFILPSSNSFSSIQVSKLSIKIRMIEKYTTDQWVDGSFIQKAIKDVSTLWLLVLPPPYYGITTVNNITCFPLNLTNSIVKTVVHAIYDGQRNPICDSSWLTLPKTTDSLTFMYNVKMESIRYPLIIRSPEVSRKLRLSIWETGIFAKFVHCTCSISWLKQLIDCNPVHLDRKWLDLPCSFNRSIAVEQFLNSTICCNSTDPPTLNNEPNMPMKCNQFLPIPPEVLYFNHADLPQCRNFSTNSWEFNPCKVSAFYRKYILAESKIGLSRIEANLVIAMVLLIISTIASIAVIVVCLCWWKRSFLQTQHNHFIAWRSNIVILENEKMQYVNAINNNFDSIASVINLEKMTKRGRNKMILDDCGEENPLIAENDFNDINELVHSAQVIQFLEKIETKSVVVIRWFLIQLIRDGHNNIVEKIVDKVKSKKIVHV